MNSLALEFLLPNGSMLRQFATPLPFEQVLQVIFCFHEGNM
jgi:hypothetical protein